MDRSALLLALLSALAAAGLAMFGAVLWLRRRLPAARPEDDRGLLLLQQQLDGLRDQQLRRSFQFRGERDPA